MGMIGNYMGEALGRSVSDFGGAMIQDEIRQQAETRKNAYEELRDQKKMELSERLDKIRRERDLEDHGKKLKQDAEQKEDTRKSTEERLGRQEAEVKSDAEEIGKKRDVGGLIETQSKIAGDSPSATPEELAGLLKTNRATYEKAGYVKPKTQISEIDDQIKASDSKGYYDTSKSLKESRATVFKDNKDAADRVLAERKVEQGDARLIQDKEESRQRHVEAMARLEKMGGGSGKSLNEGERKTYTALMNRVGSDIKTATASLKNIYNEEEKKAVQDNISVMREEQRTYMSLLAGSQSGEQSSPSKAEKPKADSWTPPKNVNKDSALTEAKAAIKAGKDPEKVKARLKMMGIDTKGL
jgi:hypothetical protein